MTYPPPPYGPPPPYNAPPAGGRGKTIAVIVVGVVVAFLVCIGGVITTVVVLANQDDEPQAATAGGAPTGVAQGGGPGVNCKVVAVPDGKAVGRPDFGRAGARTVTMTLTTNEGAVTVTMDRAKAPCTVASFEHLAGSGFFDDSPCHRLTAEGAFVLQCGDPTGTGTGGPDYRFTDENLDGARYTRGVVAMANAGPDTNGSQFFIIYRDSEIAPNYTVFGQVSAGLDVVDRVAAAGVAPGGNSPVDGRPQLEVTLRSVTVR